ncbi:MAG: DUF4082 domain-containing protein [Saprospiraceae bacterium]|jgi:hypothetical protein
MSINALRNILVALLFVAGVSYKGISQTPGFIQNTFPGGPAIPNSNLGFDFTVKNLVTISALGVYDYLNDGLVIDHPVTLYSSTGTVLATVTVPMGIIAPLNNGFRYVALTTPITLTPGDYVIMAYSASAIDASPQNFPPFSSAITIDARLDLINGSRQASGNIFAPTNAGSFVLLSSSFLITEVTVPTLSQWGILIFGLSLLAMGLVVAYNVQTSRKLVLSGYGIKESHTGLDLGRFNIPFDLDKFKINLLWSLGLALVGFVAIYSIWGKIISDDIFGMSTSFPLVSYVMYLMKEKYE